KMAGTPGFENSLEEASQTRRNVSETVVNISLGSLVKIALTSDYFKSLGLIAAFIITLYDRAKDIFFSEKANETEFFNYLSSGKLLNFLWVIVVGIILVVFIFNLVRIILVYFGFTIRKEHK